jgi:hypothetical protein
MNEQETNFSDFENQLILGETIGFEPVRIGEENGRKSWETQENYTQLLDAANTLRHELSKCLEESISIDVFLNFISSNPENWIYKEYIRVKKIQFNGLDTERIIDLKLIAINGIDAVMTAHKTFVSALDKVKLNNFFYPLRKFFNEETNQFEQNGDFWQSCDNHYSRFTQTPEQNRILGIFNRLTDVLNELDAEGILRAKHGKNEIALLTDYIEISKTSTIPFIVTDVLFYRHRTTKYRVNDPVKKSYSFADLFC